MEANGTNRGTGFTTPNEMSAFYKDDIELLNNWHLIFAGCGRRIKSRVQ